MHWAIQRLNIFLISLNIFFVLLVLANSFKGDIQISDYFALKQELENYKTKINSLKKSIEDTELEIYNITHSPEYARKVLRDKYHVTEPNEEIIFLAE